VFLVQSSGTKQYKALQSLAQKNKILHLTRVERAILLVLVYKDILFDVGLVVVARDGLGV
jgi:transcription termination factor NusB